MIRRPPRSTHCISSAASDVYKRQTALFWSTVRLSPRIRLVRRKSAQPSPRRLPVAPKPSRSRLFRHRLQLAPLALPRLPPVATLAHPRQLSLAVPCGISLHSVSPVVTGRSTLATATTVACSSRHRPGLHMAAPNTHRPLTRPLVSNRSLWHSAPRPHKAGVHGLPAPRNLVSANHDPGIRTASQYESLT